MTATAVLWMEFLSLERALEAVRAFDSHGLGGRFDLRRTDGGWRLYVALAGQPPADLLHRWRGYVFDAQGLDPGLARMLCLRQPAHG